MATQAKTPLMRQYHSIKSDVPDALLLFHLGDFYELFYDDAVVAARDLGITLTSRSKEKGEPVPMCGVPCHSVDGYIAKLIAKGHRVAICDQVEDASKTKKIVRREVTRVVTPGTASDATLLRANENNYLAAVAEKGDATGLAYIDVSTGEFRMTQMDAGEVDNALEHLGAKEVLFPSAGPLFSDEPSAVAVNGYLRTELEGWVFETSYAERTLRDQFKLHVLDGLGASDQPAALAAAGAVLHYVRDTQRGALQHLDPPTYYRKQDWMALDPVTVRNLELVEALFGGSAQSTLLRIIDKTQTPMGARLLRQWLLRPSIDRAEIESRRDGVADLHAQVITRTELEKELKPILDIERLLAKVTLGSATARDIVGLGTSLACLPAVRTRIAESPSARMSQVHQRMDELPDIRDRIDTTLSDEPPAKLTDGGTIREGFHTELDELRELRKDGRGYIARMEARERERTGIQSLKVRFNNVFGFYIEVSKANSANVPEDYDRKQTLVNAERYTTPELKEYESKVLDAEDRILALEKTLFEKLRSWLAGEARRIRSTATAVAELDVLRGLAQVAAENSYTAPEFSSGGEIQIAGGRHPVIERLSDEQGGDRFIPNDVYLDPTGNLIAIITGPNMGGKSTYLRQTALTAILAQIGSFVPATSARLPIIDRIFTRIGASDNLARGRSTFMVEMTETAQILNTATESSLILLDEVGRGTSTFDGLAIAWAVVEHIHTRTHAKTLFATHYHELTELAEQLSDVVNLHVSVKESGDNIVFLRRVEPGKADRSYGIEVARLAGLPGDVITRARSVLQMHEQREQTVSEELSTEPSDAPIQVSFVNESQRGVAEQIANTNVDELRPIEALGLIAEWKEKLGRGQ